MLKIESLLSLANIMLVTHWTKTRDMVCLNDSPSGPYFVLVLRVHQCLEMLMNKNSHFLLEDAEQKVAKEDAQCVEEKSQVLDHSLELSHGKDRHPVTTL